MRIALFEDNHAFANLIVSSLTPEGHEFVLLCHDMPSARNDLAVDANGELVSKKRFDVAIVDGNLGSMINGNDGEEICDLIGRIDPKPSIVGNSGAGAVRGADWQVYKDTYELRVLMRRL